MESNKNNKSIPKDYIEDAEKNPKEVEGLSDLDEYDMECEVITDNPAGDLKAEPEVIKDDPPKTEEERQEKELLNEMSSMIDPEVDKKEEMMTLLKDERVEGEKK